MYTWVKSDSSSIFHHYLQNLAISIYHNLEVMMQASDMLLNRSSPVDAVFFLHEMTCTLNKNNIFI